jgi:NAD-dependent deacetylase
MIGMEKTLSTLKSLIKESSRIVGFSGAGISTESGIPDFRSPGGVWSTNRTVLFEEFLNSEEDRVEYWRQKSEIWPEMRDANPNQGHYFFRDLAKKNKLLGLITQNIEGLHQQTGLPTEMIVELHGTMIHASCLSCGARISMDEACEKIKQGELSPRCYSCINGLLKPSTVSFGQSLRSDDLAQASVWASNCDLMFAVGSSLVVQPACGYPLLAKQNGAKLVIINRTETPIDQMADLVIHDEIGKILGALI